MALSGSTNYNMTAQQLIENAFSKIGVQKAEQPLQAFEIQDGLNVLNMMLKAWQAQSMHLWTLEEATLFLEPGEPSYFLGPTSTTYGSYACLTDDFIGTTLTSDVLIGATVLPVEDTVGMTAGDYCGVQLSNDVRQWTTIASVDSLTQITVTDPLLTASTDGYSVFTFTTLLDRPLRISSLRRKTFGYDDEIPAIMWSRQQYFDQVNKLSQGTVVNWYYDPYLDNGRLYVWQTAGSVNQIARFTFESALDDIDDVTNNLEFPVEWLECISYNLAARLADTYDVPMEKQQTVQARAQQFLDDLLGWDEEMTSINVKMSPYAY